MGIFKSLPKSFCAIVLEDKTCKFHFRELSSDKKILDEKFDIIGFSEELNFEQQLKKAINFEEKTPIMSVLISNAKQGVVSKKADVESCGVSLNDVLFETVDDDFITYIKKSDTQKLDEIFGVKFDYYMSPFKVLYFLLKNENFSGNCLFVLKLSNEVIFIVSNKQKVLYTSIVSIADELLNISVRNEFNFVLDDGDEIFYAILKNEIEKFYSLENGEFINNIYIYNNGSLHIEISYVIYTRLLIKTNLIPIDLADYINKISIKQSKNKII